MGVNAGVWRWSSLTVAAAFFMSAASANAALDGQKVVRSPARTWLRELSDDQSRLTLVSKARVAAIDMRIGDRLPNDTDIAKLVERLTGQSVYTIRGRWPKTTLSEASVQMGLSFALSDGRKGMYVAIWRRRADGQYGMASYMAIATAYTDANIADFKLVRSMGNQLARGLVLAAPAQLAPLPAPVIIAAAPPLPVSVPPPVAIAAAVPMPAVAAAPSVTVGAVAVPVAVSVVVTPPVALPVPVTLPVPVPAVADAPVFVPVAIPVAVMSPAAPPVAVAVSTPAVAPVVLPATAALPVPALAAARSYPFVAVAGAGVAMNQIASLLYAPLESSEVFVLFKDGSFHENLPVALEEWNAGESRKGDPSSWGKWKTAAEADEFELAYAADDVVTIAARKIKPAKSGMVLEGNYVIESDVKSPAAEEIEFAGNRFGITRSGARFGGTYRVDGYSLIMNYDDGRSEHRPFFVVPPEEDGDDPSIWLGDTLRVRLD